MDGEVVHALLCLLDERVAVDLPRQLFGPAADFFQRLINRHRADGHRRVAQNPLPGGVNVAAGGQIHHGVGAPQGRPAQLVHFFGDGRAHGRVADVRVDLHQEVAADDHRLELGVIHVGGNDRAAAGDLRSHELRGQPFTDGNELHLGRHVALARVVELRGRLPGRARRTVRPPDRCVLRRPRDREPMASRSAGNPFSRSVTRGPLVSYTCSDGSPPASAISRTGTRTPPGPSIRDPAGVGKRLLKIRVGQWESKFRRRHSPRL